MSERRREVWELEIRAAAAELVQVDEFAARVFMLVYPEAANLLSFVLREAVLNAVEANEDEISDKKLKISIAVEHEGLVMLVFDPGKGFAAGWQEELAKASMEDNLLEERGRGLLFIKDMVDEIWSDWQSEQGHVFGMRKKWRGV